MYKFFILFFVVLNFSFAHFDYVNDTFPSWFMFGASTSAYQIEGGWNEGGKGPNIWDTYTHDYPWMIAHHENGNVACDSYHKFREDIKLAAFMGLDFYRFSISWARVLPYGYSNYVNEIGIQFYNDVIDDIIAHNITPMVTIYHWDLPQTLQNIGGWANPLMIDIYADYARLLFDRYGDRVKLWITFNEPKQICAIGYGTIYLAPGYVNQSGIADYQCGHTVLLSHAKAYHMYKNEYQPWQKGKIAITIDSCWYMPTNDDPENVEATFRKQMFAFGWFMNPIFSKEGNYPQIMIDRVGNRSKLENFPRSRLPAFTPEEIESLKGASDFLGLNSYTSAMVSNDAVQPPIQDVSYYADIAVYLWQPKSWPKSSDPWLKVTPFGIRRLLNFVKDFYGDFPIIITENGYADKGELRDYKRIRYYKEYLNEVQLALVEDKVNVIGYAAWALIDNFEWDDGYTQKFGLNYVNFSDPNRERKIKNSARCYKQFIKLHAIDWDCTGNVPDIDEMNFISNTD